MSKVCTQPVISWLEMEHYVLGESGQSQEIRAHLEECAACASVERRITSDERSMPALVVPSGAAAAKRARRDWRWSFALLPALALLLVLFAPRDGQRHGTSGSKGGDDSLQLVRERAGVLLEPRRFGPGDRFKALVTCSPGLRYADIVVEQSGRLFYPLEPVQIECGNQIDVPGAFSLDGGPLRVCLVLSDGLPARGSLPGDAPCHELAPATNP